jgi:ketosteroid isomerase-like protein
MVEKQFAFIRAGTFDYELHPLSVTVLDDVAVTFYTVHTIYRAADGTESSGDSRLTHTWLRTDGSWRIVGGMSAPPPAGGGSGGG